MTDIAENNGKSSPPNRSIGCRVWLSIYLPLLFVVGLLNPLVAVLVAALLGFWTVCGRGDLWGRLLIAAGLLWWLEAGSFVRAEAINYSALLVSAFVLAMISTMVIAIAFAQYRRVPHKFRFSVWDAGGVILVCGLVFTYLRQSVDWDQLVTTFTWNRNNFVVVIPPVSLTVALASMPLFTPREFRTDKHILVAAGAAIVLAPFVESIVLSQLFVDWSGGAFFLFMLGHAIGVAATWFAVFPLEQVGGFSEVE